MNIKNKSCIDGAMLNLTGHAANDALIEAGAMDYSDLRDETTTNIKNCEN